MSIPPGTPPTSPALKATCPISFPFPVPRSSSLEAPPSVLALLLRVALLQDPPFPAASGTGGDTLSRHIRARHCSLPSGQRSPRPSLLPAHRGARHQPSSTTVAAARTLTWSTHSACMPPHGRLQAPSLLAPRQPDLPSHPPWGLPACRPPLPPSRSQSTSAFLPPSQASRVVAGPPSASQSEPHGLLLFLPSSVRTPRIPSQRLPKRLSLGHQPAAATPGGQWSFPIAGPGGQCCYRRF